MRGCGRTCYHRWWDWRCERGGGSKPQPPQFITPPPPQITQAPPPNIQQNAEDLYKAQLQYNPLLTQQAAQLQQQYGPQLAQSQTDIQAQQAPQLAQSQFALQQQYGPLYRSLYEQLFPTQVAGQEALARQAGVQVGAPSGLTPEQLAYQQQARAEASGRVPSSYQEALGQRALQQFQSPIGLTPEQQAAQDVIRDREQERFLRGVRTQANVGGTLYGGQREERERLGLGELATRYSLQDIGLQQQQRQEALSQLMQAAQQEQGIAAQRQAFGMQDIGLQANQRAQALQNMIASSQVVFPQVQQPGVGQFGAPQFGQGVVPGADALLAAIMQGQIIQQPVYQPGNPGSPGYFQSMFRGLGGQQPTFY